jgi:hypothetical protein
LATTRGNGCPVVSSLGADTR